MGYKKAKSKQFCRVKRRKKDEVSKGIKIQQKPASNNAVEESDSNTPDNGFPLEESNSPDNCFLLEESNSNTSDNEFPLDESNSNTSDNSFSLEESISISPDNNFLFKESNSNTPDDKYLPPPYPAHDHDYCGIIEQSNKDRDGCEMPFNSPLVLNLAATFNPSSCSGPFLTNSYDLNNSSLVFTNGEEDMESDSFVQPNTLAVNDSAEDPLLIAPPLPTNDHIPSPALFSGEEVQLIKLVAESVQPLAPRGWICKDYSDVLELSLLSEGCPRIVQRAIGVNCQGKISVSVHGKILNNLPQVFSSIPKVPSLESNNVKNYVEYIVNLLNIVNELQVCVGTSIGSQSQFWKFMNECIVDENLFRETRYGQCCRSVKCSYLVSPSCLRCASCTTLHRTICRRMQRNGDCSDLPPNKSKPDKILTPPEIQWRIKSQSKEIKHLRRIIQRLKERVKNRSKPSQCHKSKCK